MDGKTIITVIVACVSYMAINKWILTPMKRGPNRIRKDDDDDPPSLPSSSAVSSSSPLPPEQRDDPASIRSSSTLPPPPPPEQEDDPASIPSSSAEASSSSSSSTLPPPHPLPPPELEHDVFLSFRGTETREGIVSFLYGELKKSGIKTFMDEEGLEPGTGIAPCLLEAIEKSRSAIVLLSPDYASSRWCLDELDSIVQGLESRDTIVLPVFYKVEPTDVRHQTGSFEQAFIGHEEKHREKVERWKAVLTKVADISGWELKKYRNEKQLVENIVQHVCNIVRDLEIDSPDDFVEYEATRIAVGKVMNALKDDRFTAIGIYGTGGIGKTTMARHVAAEAKRNGIFRHVAMAVVTHKPDLKYIQGQLAVQLGVRLEEETISGAIVSRNKTLIILDDIWERTDLSSIGIPSYKKLQVCKSKVLLTTRDFDVCRSMDSQQNIALNLLSPKDSWKLFVKKTRMPSEKLIPFTEVASNLVELCAGLPIALVAIARALRDEDINEWNEAAKRLKSSRRGNLDDVVFNCIKLSYDQLTSEDAKLCFLLCCLFPEDYDIQIEELMMYAFGKGLFRNCDTLQDVRLDCRSAVRSLKSSSLLLGTNNDGQVRMHDVIRRVARLISLSEDGQSFFVEAGRQLEKWPKIKDGYCAISLMMNKIGVLPKELGCSKLKILLLQHNPNVSTIPEFFLKCPGELGVLNLSKTDISVLPPSFSRLSNLHSLLLDSCAKISDISVLGQLSKLEILSLRKCCPKEVPEEIGDLTGLRLLDISESSVVKIASQVISRLSKLEELYMQCGFAGWRNKDEAGNVRNEANVGFDELIGLPYLCILKVGIPNAKVLPTDVKNPLDWHYFDICISSDSEVRESTWKPHTSHDYSKTLTLSTTIHNLPEWFIDKVTKNAEKLYYRKCEDLNNILVEYDRGRLNELRHLFIIGSHENLIEVMNADARDSNNVAFPKLEELHLLDVESINNLCVGKLPPRSLCKLKLLHVRKCHNLVGALLQSPLLERLQCLEKLHCTHLYGLDYVFGSGKTTTCEELQEMRLCRLPDLRKIWSVHAPHSVSLKLRILAISGCKMLKSLFTFDMASCLSQLEDLWVHSCFSLDRIVEASEEIGKKNVIFPKLKNLVLEYLPRLRRLYSNSSGGPTSLEIKFPSLEYFYNVECPRFSPSVPNFHSTKQVQVNDVQHYSSLKTRLWENLELDYTIFEDGQREWKYDVYLSFRGPDTRKGITIDIYDGLTRRGIKTFMDDPDVQVGDAISPTLIAAINESRFAIVVLSPNYGSSTWCLEELAKIYECMEDRNIFPVFYHVELSDVRYQERSFKDAFTQHEDSRRHGDKVDTWRDVLKQVTNFSGWHTKNYQTDKELLDAIVNYVCPWSKVVPDAILSTGDFQLYEATRQVLDEVMKALIDDEVTVVGVYGMGGVGKTTMIEHVAAQSCRNGTFHYVIMAVVSQLPDLRKIQATLADLLGLDLQKVTEKERAARLHEEIMGREKLIIILDDIWERTDLPSIGVPSYKELQKCKSKVLLTTRIRSVCHVMECQVSIRLNTLSEEDSWSFFIKSARRSFESPTFEDVAKKVVKECRGLPIALRTVARALGDKELAEWMRAAQRLMKSQTANPDDNGEAYKCIKRSYDYLEDQEYKSYFLLCCLFPEDYDIPIEHLFKYAIGKGLFGDADTLQEARERAESVARHLQCSCLLLEGKDGKYIRMHDVVRDAAIQIAQSEEGFLVKAGCGLEDWPRQLHEGYSAISLMSNGIKKLPEKLVCPKLQILSLNRNRHIKEIPEAFFQSPNELRVLDLSRTSFSLLPQSFGLLTDLQALFLDSCTITDISMLGKLKRLEILSMRGTELKELSIEVGGLTNLRILDNTEGVIERIPPGVISKLHSLEELYIKGFTGWGRKVEGDGEETNACFGEVTTLSKLRVLKVIISDAGSIPKYVEFIPNWVKFDISIGERYEMEIEYDEIEFGNQIYLYLNKISLLPKWFSNEIMKMAERLEWSRCERLIDIFVESEHGRLQRLKHLTIRRGDLDGVYLEELENLGGFTEVDPTNERIPSAPVLENLETLKSWNVEFLPAMSLCSLKFLQVGCCRSRENVLLPSKLLQGLPNLEELQCYAVVEIEYVFGCEALEETEQSKLRKIEFSALNSLRSICEGAAPPAMFQNLQSLSIKQCRLQGSLFTAAVAQNLDQLRYLDLYNCHFLERIVEASNKKINFQKLKDLRLTELPRLDYDSTTIDFECPSLEDLYLWDCPKFLVSVSDFHSFNQVQLHDDRYVGNLVFTEFQLNSEYSILIISLS